jgi:hypothetical protein
VPIPRSAVTFGVSGPLLAGLAVTSHNVSALSQVTFDATSVGSR